MTQIRLLGPVEIWDADRRPRPVPPQQRAVLAVLAIDAGRPVPVDALIDRVWGPTPPSQARSALYATVSRLRQVLRSAAAPQGSPPQLLRHSGGGYLLRAGAQQVDLHHFRSLGSHALRPECPPAERAETLSRALELWRGPGLADVPGDWPTRVRDGWESERLELTVEWARAELFLGNGQRVLGPLRAVLMNHPLAENAASALMRALVAANRTAEALDCYATTRAVLGDRLGVEPGAELQRLHRSILRGEIRPDDLGGIVTPAGRGPAGPPPAAAAAAAAAEAEAEEPTAGLAMEAAATGPAMEAATTGPAMEEPAATAAAVQAAATGTAAAGPATGAAGSTTGTAAAGPATGAAGSTTGPAAGSTTGPAASPGIPTAVEVVPAGPRVAPAQLPANARGFTGRGRELAELDRCLGVGGAERDGAGPAGTAMVAVIAGTAGVGKTALAVSWANRRRDRFRDGQLYIDLRGYDPDRPVIAMDALYGFLRDLGVPPGDIPADLDRRAARYRSALAGRRMLIMLDNAGTIDQVRPLLPGAGPSRVIVTSRDSLSGLIARDGAHRIALDLLPAGEARQLLRSMVGDRVDAEPTATDRLIDACARLPLALRIAAEMAVDNPQADLTDLADDLADAQDRLDLLDAGGDPRAAVRVVFSWSYNRLPAAAARAFRMLGLHPAASWDVYSVAALSAVDLVSARTLLSTLARAHLIQPAATGSGRYGMHDLLRAYAREQGCYDDERADREAAWDRLLGFYVATTMRADSAAFSDNRAYSARRPPTYQGPVPPIRDGEAARAWLDAERASLAEVALAAAQSGAVKAVQLLISAWRTLEAGGLYEQTMTLCKDVLAIARTHGDRAGEIQLLSDRSGIHFYLGQYWPARWLLQQALVTARETGDLAGQSLVLSNLGATLCEMGEYDQAIDHIERSLEIRQELGLDFGFGSGLVNLSELHRYLGSFQPAIDFGRRALAISRRTGGVMQAAALCSLGLARCQLGQYRLAESHLRRGLAIVRQMGATARQGPMLDALGQIAAARGCYAEAIAYHRQALAIHRGIGSRRLEVHSLNHLGRALCQSGRPDEAIACHLLALDMTSEAAQRYPTAKAHDGLAHAYHAIGETATARDHWHRALTLFAELGTPESGEMLRLLARHE